MVCIVRFCVMSVRFDYSYVSLSIAPTHTYTHFIDSPTCLLDAGVGAAAEELGGAGHLPVVEPLEQLVQERLGAVAVAVCFICVGICEKRVYFVGVWCGVLLVFVCVREREERVFCWCGVHTSVDMCVCDATSTLHIAHTHSPSIYTHKYTRRTAA